MKKTLGILTAAVLFVFTAMASDSKGERTSYEVNTKESKVHWTGKKVTGEHTGYISIGNGTVMVEGEKVVGGEVNIDLNSMVCTDLTNEGMNQKLIGHLKSDDFFSVEKYPEANFAITSMKMKENGEYHVEGNLTMKGATHKISFPASATVEDGKVQAKGTAVVDRTKWDIRYGSGKFFQGLGDRMIYDDFEITFELIATSGGEHTSKL